jgi:hypothetical protein
MLQKPLPIGIQSFSKLINGNYLYVDKTEEIHRLVDGGGQYFFISRPRRFGKSLTVSTLYHLFSGNKELFKGLWIYDKIEWKKHPVIYIDLSEISYKTAEILENELNIKMEKIAALYDITLNQQRDYKGKFVDLIENLAGKGDEGVIILIDEYDKPIIDHLEAGKKDTAKENREVLKNFYSIIKSSDKYLKFVFLTGVSKFSRVSIFSGLNNLNDITLDDKYAALMGYTEDELCRYFPVKGARGDRLEQIRKWYNGYSWDGKNFVYNPFSILLYFEKNRFASYWFATGTPTFLVNTIKEKEIPLQEFEHVEADDSTFESFDIDHLHVTSLLFQTGYLTIKERTIDPLDDNATIYYLDYPNREVKESFLKHLLKGFCEKDFNQSKKILKQVKLSLEHNKLDDFFAVLTSFFASIPYNIFVDKREGYYSSILYLLLRLSGVSILPEPETNIGRIDALVETERFIYIMELKIGTSREALDQVKEKKYYEPFLTSGKLITLVGIGIEPAKRNITDYLWEQL